MTIDQKTSGGWLKNQKKQTIRSLIPVVALGTFSTFLVIAQGYILACIIAIVLKGQTEKGLRLIIVFLCVAGLRMICLAMWDIILSRFSSRSRRLLRKRLINAILSYGVFFFRSHHTGELSTTIIDQVELLDGYFSRWIPSLVIMVLGPVLIFSAVLFIDPVSAFVLALCGIFTPIAQGIFGIGASMAARRQFIAMSRLQTRFLDRIKGIATIVLLNRTEDEAAKLAQASEELRRRTMKILRVAFLSSSAIDVAMVVALVVIVLLQYANFTPFHPLGGVLFPPAVKVVFVLVLVPEFFAPFRTVSLAYQDRAYFTAAEKNLQIIPHIVSNLTGKRKNSEIIGWFPRKEDSYSIECKDICFRWDKKRKEGLHDFSFYLPPKQNLLITGSSGAGKTTLIELLLGFIQPDHGEVLLRGIYNTEDFSKKRSSIITWMGQKPFFFLGSIRDNIRFGRLDATEDELQKAVKAASVDRFLSLLPNGIETRIGEGGYGLSGGQAQRVAVARAYLRDSPILLLDEPTAHLDPDTEIEVFNSLRVLAKDRTTILISHSRAAKSLSDYHMEIMDGRITRYDRVNNER